MISRPKQCEEKLRKENGEILVPATVFTRPKRANQKIHLAKSFDGGHQIFVNKDSIVEYTLTADDLLASTTRYELVLRVCTVHRKEQPFLLTINGGSPVEVPIPYTVGEWADTKGVKVTLDVGRENVLSFERQFKKGGTAIKYIKLKAL